MSEKLNNAKNLYIRGIQDGELEEVLSCYMGESYTQHSTGVGEEQRNSTKQGGINQFG